MDENGPGGVNPWNGLFPRATAGSLLGACFGPGYLEERWWEPFNDDIRTALAWFYERSLSRLAKRMGELPTRVAAQSA